MACHPAAPYRPFCLSLLLLLAGCDEPARPSQAIGAFETLDSYTSLGDWHNQGVHRSLEAIRERPGISREEALEIVRATTQQFLNEHGLIVPGFDAASFGLTQATDSLDDREQLDRLLRRAGVGSTARGYMRGVLERTLSESSVERLRGDLMVLGVEATARLSAAEAALVLISSMVALGSVSYWEEYGAVWVDAMRPVESRGSASRAVARMQEVEEINWREVAIADVAGAVGGAVASELTGCSGLLLTTCFALGGIGGGVSASVAKAVTDVLTQPEPGPEAGPTTAPDLQAVGNFRLGPKDDDGSAQTLVDFTFYESAYLGGRDRSNFFLIPLDGGDPVRARDAQPSADVVGDPVVTLLFPGDIDASDFARGAVETGTVTSHPAPATETNPLNIVQTKPISNGGLTENPDLIEVRRADDNVLVFAFDEPLAAVDVEASGLRIYFPLAVQRDTISDAGASVVVRQSPNELRAFFTGGLPDGFTLADAVGAFVLPGTVQAVEGSRGANEGRNAVDELVIFLESFPSDAQRRRADGTPLRPGGSPDSK